MGKLDYQDRVLIGIINAVRDLAHESASASVVHLRQAEAILRTGMNARDDEPDKSVPLVEPQVLTEGWTPVEGEGDYYV